jgi:hypothetical protein
VFCFCKRFVLVDVWHGLLPLFVAAYQSDFLRPEIRRSRLACEIRIFLYSNLNLVVCAQTSARRWTQLLRRTL